MNSKIITVITVVVVVLLGIFLINRHNNQSKPISETTPSPNTESTPADGQPPTNQANASATSAAKIVVPISRANERITKKFFGTYVTPQNSPVQPEKFTGFHTGLDFETFPEEKDADVAINVICSGKLLVKRFATGYGGVAVQACTINGQAVTVVYGHMRLASIKPTVGQMLNAGDALGVLGTGYSSETDGERKHLHLDIHIGTGINIKGYVQTKAELSGWLDPKVVLGL